MKKTHNTIKTVTFLGGFFTISAAVIMVVFLVMSLFGLIHPRKTRITLHTMNISNVYDGQVHCGTKPDIQAGSLLPGHVLEVRSIAEYDKVGTYINAPEFVILDETGADVTNQYDIRCKFGLIQIQPRQITLKSDGANKLYDGEPLTSGGVELVAGTLVNGHSITVNGGNSLLYPGCVRVDPQYRIVTNGGVDVTDQYYVTEIFENLEIVAHTLHITTGSAEKMFDNSDLSCDEWELTGGKLLDGHNIEVRMTGLLTDAGTTGNTAEVKVYDSNGLDVTQIYDIRYWLGSLTIHGIPLQIKTMSDSKIYDGSPISCNKWELTNGELEPGATLKVKEYTIHDKIGTVENAISFAVIDEDGMDVTHRYNIHCDNGELTLQPRAIAIRTASASKVYDGEALLDNSYTIISGELCDGDIIELNCVSIENVGYTENYIQSCIVYRIKDSGAKEDITAYYRITFEFGSLEITAQ